jgi:hypothetical protein
LPDYLIVSQDLGTTLMINRGGASYVPRELQTTGCCDVAVGYLNGDGLPDLAGGSGTRAWVAYQRRDGTFEFVDPNLSFPDGTSGVGGGVKIADVTGDGFPDLVYAHGENSPNGAIAVVPGTAQGGLGDPIYYHSYDIASPVDIADLNGDGRLDVVVGHSSFPRWGYYLQQADGSLGPEQLVIDYHNELWPSGLAAGDIDCDGRPDVALANDGGSLDLFRQAPSSALRLNCQQATSPPPSSVPPPDYIAGAPVDTSDPILPVLPTPAPRSVQAGDVFTLSSDRIVAIDPATGRQRLVTNGAVSRAVGGGAYLQQPNDIEVGSDGTLYIADSGDDFNQQGRIIGVNPSSGRQWLVSTDAISQSEGGAAGLYGVNTLAVARDGHLLVAGATRVGADYQDAIVDVNPSTGFQRVISDTAISQGAGGQDVIGGSGIEEMSTGEIATDSSAGDSVARTSRTTGAQTRIAQGNLLDAPGHSDLAGNDELLVANGGDKQPPDVVGVDMRTGAQRVVVPNLRDGQAYLAPVDVGMQQDGKLSLAMVHVGPFDQYLYSSVFRFDPAIGTATKLSGDDLLFGVVALTVYRDPGSSLPALPSDLSTTASGIAPPNLSPAPQSGAATRRKCRRIRRHRRGKSHRCRRKRHGLR